VTGTSFLDRASSAWRTAWPSWLLAAFAAVAAIRLLPGGYARAALAAPILLLVPGAVTLGVLFGGDRRPRGATLACCAGLLSVLWAVFCSLALYALTVRITAVSTYWALLAVTAVLAAVAQTRMLLARQPAGRQAAGASGLAGAETGIGYREPAATARRGSWGWVAVAVVVGTALLTGATYVQARLPRPAPTGYTWLAWTGPQIDGVSTVGTHGTRLPFKIVHREPGTGTFQLRAEWLTAPAQLLAMPITLRIGPGRTYRGALFVPPLPAGCTYRLVVTLTAVGHVDPLTLHPQTWSINADVRERGRPVKPCPR
jgi:hypothetical protein